ncbi:hypothetical protein [Burkholderia sp. WAC0059]|uniref:hypothetical protein n=1 Tax=Burkholderia sp. WAC0059 TaxID=2066022 RepID=UPI0015E072EE|nr:hypothetical protein [Burkholderia sp. WAC0059]
MIDWLNRSNGVRTLPEGFENVVVFESAAAGPSHERLCDNVSHGLFGKDHFHDSLILVKYKAAV